MIGIFEEMYARHYDPPVHVCILDTTDPGVCSTLEDVFSVLAKNPSCHRDLHSQFLPTAVQLLDSNDQGLPLGMVAVS